MHSILVTLVPCDAAVFTSKWNLIGVFSSLTFGEFPGKVPPFHVYIRITGIIDPAPFEVTLQLVMTTVDAEGVADSVLWRASGNVVPTRESDADFGTFEGASLVANARPDGSFNPVVIPALGHYQLVAIVEDEVTARVTIPVSGSKGKSP